MATQKPVKTPPGDDLLPADYDPVVSDHEITYVPNPTGVFFHCFWDDCTFHTDRGVPA